MPRRVVLLVEDEPPVLQLTCLLLQQENFMVLPTSNAAEALEVAQGVRFDLLLCDMQMGDGLTGIELAEKILAEKPGIKVVIMSGTPGAQSEITRKGYDFLAKPFTRTHLIERVREVVRGKATA
jgi:CheY-like chemotaxis protein